MRVTTKLGYIMGSIFQGHISYKSDTLYPYNIEGSLECEEIKTLKNHSYRDHSNYEELVTI
jgi:hypothetical protein